MEVDIPPRRPAMRLLSIVMVLAAAAGLSACGGSTRGAAASTTTSAGGDGSAVIVRVAGKVISKAQLDHWIPIEAILARDPLPQEPPPPGLVPDPPGYTACIAYLRANPFQTSAPTTKLTSAQLKHECQHHDQLIRQNTLQILISYIWSTTEAASLGIHVSDQEVQAEFAGYKHRQFGTEAKFQRYLAATGATVADELLHRRFDLTGIRMENKLLRLGLARAREFYREYPKRWAARTDCSPGYVIPECRQYKGKEAPEPSI
jgi:foldase protein PrsA